MPDALIKNKVYYKIFDKTFQQLTYLYSFHKATDEAKLAEIKNNLAQIKQMLAAEQIVVLKQIHSTIVVDADDIADFTQQLEGDALVTTKPGIALGTLTADCVPVLISSSDGKVIGTAHCGWQGAKNNLIANLIKKMKSKGANSFKVIIGPAIAQKSYEVDHQRYQDCLNTDPLYQQFFAPSTKQNYYMLDIPGLVAWQLRKQQGITDIIEMHEDTYIDAAKYPSYRRACHQGMQNEHNILSSIIIR